MLQHLLLLNLVLVFVYMTLWFIVARLRRRLDTVDIAWGLGFVVVAWSTALQFPTKRSLFIAVLVSIWGLRLANHIWQRAKTRGEDPRYQVMTAKWRGNVWWRAYFTIFLLQGALVWSIGLPIMLAANQPLAGPDWLLIVGAIIWLKGFAFEAISDRQLAHFLQQPNHPKVLETGLWHYSRHPNYFGELLQWWGIGIIALQASWGWLGLIGPLVLTLLIVFISGIPPIERRRAKDAAYQAYQQRTSPLIPWPSKSIS